MDARVGARAAAVPHLALCERPRPHTWPSASGQGRYLAQPEAATAHEDSVPGGQRHGTRATEPAPRRAARAEHPVPGAVENEATRTAR
jgi:hypothetical protein